MTRLKLFWKSCRKQMTRRWALTLTYQIVTFLLSVIIVYSVANYAITKSYRARRLNLRDSFTITACTGENGNNPIESLKKVLEKNGISVEIDVFFEDDGTPVLGNGENIIGKTRVPLKDALELIPDDDRKVFINLKQGTNYSELQNTIFNYSLENRVFLTGVTEKNIYLVKESCPKLKYYLNLSPSRTKIIGSKYQEKVLTILQSTGAMGINCNYMYAGETLASLLHDNGYLLSAWTVNNKDDMARCLVNGVDNIITGKTDVVSSLIDNWGN